jgi:hypothetical protein
MPKFNKRETELLITGIRMYVDECQKLSTHHDMDVRNVVAVKKEELYKLWSKVSPA